MNLLKNETFRLFAMSCISVLISVCICTLILVATFAFAIWNFDQPPRAYHLADSLQEGMNKQEVQKILGPPHGYSGDDFYYTRSGVWGIFYVYFDEEGKLKEHHYDR